MLIRPVVCLHGFIGVFIAFVATRAMVMVVLALPYGAFVVGNGDCSGGDGGWW